MGVLCLCMLVETCMHVFLCVSMCNTVYVHVSVCVSACVCVFLLALMFLCVHDCVFAIVCICIMSVWICACVCAHPETVLNTFLKHCWGWEGGGAELYLLCNDSKLDLERRRN